MFHHCVRCGISNRLLQAGFYKMNITSALVRVLIHLIVVPNGILPADRNESSCKLQYHRRQEYLFISEIYTTIWNYTNGFSSWSHREGNRIRLLMMFLFVFLLFVAPCGQRCVYIDIVCMFLCVSTGCVCLTTGWTWRPSLCCATTLGNPCGRVYSVHLKQVSLPSLSLHTASLLEYCRSFVERSQAWSFSTESFPEEERGTLWKHHSHGFWLDCLLMA